VGRAAADAEVAVVEGRVVGSAEGDEVPGVVGSLLRPELDVVRVAGPATAARNLAAVAVALADLPGVGLLTPDGEEVLGEG
jgi:hypothetical protein